MRQVKKRGRQGREGALEPSRLKGGMHQNYRKVIDVYSAWGFLLLLLLQFQFLLSRLPSCFLPALSFNTSMVEERHDTNLNILS